MEKIIEIDLHTKEDLTEKYNRNKISKDLINYIIEEAIFINKEDTVKLMIYNCCDLNENCINIIREGLEIEYQNSLKKYYLNNLKQLFLLILGILFLAINIIIADGFIFKEIFLIVGWVSIWEVVDIELFTDIKERRKRRVLKKLLKSSFIIKSKK